MDRVRTVEVATPDTTPPCPAGIEDRRCLGNGLMTSEQRVILALLLFTRGSCQELRPGHRDARVAGVDGLALTRLAGSGKDDKQLRVM